MPGAFAEGLFTGGRLAWTSGANGGAAADVRLQAGARLELWEAPARPVAPGDTFRLTAGCDKHLATCRDRFANAINFQGFQPDVGFTLAAQSVTEGNGGGNTPVTVTATLAGQIVMQGFLDLKLPDWLQRLVTRGIAIIPVIVVAALYGESGTAQLLVFSQVVLSMQLPFAVIPLVRFVSDKRKMGALAISMPVAVAAWIVAGLIVILNLKLLFDTIFGT